MKKFIFAALLLSASSASAATSQCQREVISTERQMNRAESKCERSQSQVTRLELIREDAVQRIMERENISNIDEGTGSISCGIREIFPGECEAKKRRRKAVERINRINSYYNRRISLEQSKVNKFCEQFGQLRATYDTQRSQCTL